MIGDSETDVATARAARVPVIVVSFGYTETPPHELGADLVIDHFDELERALQTVARA
jgi:phosphoglycolate phosphatase